LTTIPISHDTLQDEYPDGCTKRQDPVAPGPLPGHQAHGPVDFGEHGAYGAATFSHHQLEFVPEWTFHRNRRGTSIDLDKSGMWGLETLHDM
jgi:hypothetical protein